MLLKLFKYDMKKAMKTFLVMLIIIAGITLLGAACGLVYSATYKYLYGDFQEIEDGFMQVASTSDYIVSSGLLQLTAFMSMLLSQMCQMVPFIVCIVYVIMNYNHFRRDVLSDRGYLTLTRPVTAKQILSSKLLSSFIGTAALLVVSFISSGVMNFCSRVFNTSPDELLEIYGDNADSFFGWSGHSFLAVTDMVACAILVPLFIIALLFYVYLSFYFFTLLGYTIAKRKKTGAGIGLFLGGSYIMYIVLIVLFFLTLFVQGFIFNAFAAYADNYYEALVSVSILPDFLLITGLGIMMWFVSKHLLNKKIDLL